MLKKVAWLGDSKRVISQFPAGVRSTLGAQLFRLQEGKLPLNSRPMKTVGPGVFELRDQDRDGWYRVIYALELGSTIFVLHCFKKKSAKTSITDLNLARARYRTRRIEK